ncbi:hypothetical protein [Glycomyces albidus]|uniref:Carboxypeptidase regulatory-like domain-containing protein n=1 Tax=Glycomyces albidus TaxID=2656774 RepID=A0A6L5G3W9_9ACTN|nr:hypothetical protein [Glycomyces albidus]MQM24263.1 hypothetical protein [Glycomyces albidus]
MKRTGSLFTLAAATLLAFAACGPSDEDDSPEPTTTAPDEIGATSTQAPSPSASPTAALPEAADGTDYGACYDGSCEVFVTAPVEIPLDPGLDTEATSAAVTEVDGWVIGVAFFADGRPLGSVTWNDARANGEGTMYTTYDGASFELVAYAEGEYVIAVSAP